MTLPIKLGVMTKILGGHEALPAGASMAQRYQRLDNLTALRFFAAFGVAICHLGELMGAHGDLSQALGFWKFGVDFFFVLSGFVLTWSWKPQRSTSRFYWLRFARIWPMHLAVMTLLFCLGTRGRLSEVILQVFLLQQWKPTSAYALGINGVTWTLSVEVFFYALFPFFIHRVFEWSIKQLVTAAMAGWMLYGIVILASNHFIGRGSLWVSFSNPVSRIPQFYCGMAVAIILGRININYISNKIVNIYYLFSLFLVGIVWLSYIILNGARPNVWSWIFTPAIVSVITASALRGMKFGGNAPKYLVTLGEWSFAMYLVHRELIFYYLWPHIKGMPPLAVIFILLSSVIGAAGIGYVLWERPVERWLRARGPLETA